LRKADVLVLPESFRYHDGQSFLDDLAPLGFNHLAERDYITLQIAARRRQIKQPGEGWWELAIASRHPIVERRDLPLAHTLDDNVPTRHAIAVVIDVDGVEVDLVAFHVSSKLWFAAPMVQLTSLRRAVHAAGIDGAKRPALLVGDANLWRSWMGLLLPGWTPLLRGRTFPAWRPHSQIDQILGRGVTPIDGRVLPDTCTSDHRPVIARVAIP
jgi:endonuclease/exonuclease/phosphatase (EEP) superfamily protein YafD